MATISRLAALHVALWGYDPYYRRSWYAWPACMALLVAGWIYAGPESATKSGASWGVPNPLAKAVPVNSAAGAPAPPLATIPNDVVDRLNLSKPVKIVGATSGQKALLYDYDANDAKGKQYVGAVRWYTDRGPVTENQEFRLHAEAEFPERKLKMTLLMRRNTDVSAPASHTVELAFTVPPDFEEGGIAFVPGLLTPASGQYERYIVSGEAAKDGNDRFIIKLSGDPESKTFNLMHLRDVPAIEIAILYGTGRRAALTLQKGDGGSDAFKAAWDAWGQ